MGMTDHYGSDVPNWTIGSVNEHMGEGESWFTQGRVVEPQAKPIEALPKQQWDGYKPNFIIGHAIAHLQQPLRNLPYFWENDTGYGGASPQPFTYTTKTVQGVSGNADQIFGMAAPTRGIYTGLPSSGSPAATTWRD